MVKSKTNHTKTLNGVSEPIQLMSFEAKFKLALDLIQNKKTTDAKILFNEILFADPRHAESWFYSALIAEKEGSPQDAIRYLETALEIDPQNLKYLYTIGDFYYEQNYLDQGIKIFENIIKIQPDDCNGYYNLANFLQKQKKYDQAILNYQKVLELDDKSVNAIYNLGNILIDIKKYEYAIQCFTKVIELQPNSDDALSNLGFLQLEIGNYEEALEYLNQAISINPRNLSALNNLGKVNEKKFLYLEALEFFNKAIKLNPNHAQSYYNRGVVLDATLSCKEAVHDYDKAIALQPELADAHWNKSLNLLLTGDFTKGWSLYEWRWKVDKLKLLNRTFSQPLWLGNENILGKTILLHAEQGLGDTIQFCRYAKLVKKLGAKVLLEVPKSLLGLLSALEGVDQLIESGNQLPDFDYHCPLMTLPLAFKTELANIPNRIPYLAASNIKHEKWAQKLGVKPKLLVGLVWSGSTTHKNDYNRSLKLKQLLPYLPDLCEYVSLQKEVREIDKQVLNGSNIKQYGDELNDFSDTAALCQLMDLVISVDTSVAHLAGAISKTTWVLLPHVPDWRWLLDREDSPWYPSIKIYSQPSHGDWDSVMKRIRHDLIEYSNNWKLR
jgi:tetratricopeptide (TPR) repeat protein